MSVEIRPSRPFSNGMEYEFFLEKFCDRCVKLKHGCRIVDAMEQARFDISLFPTNDVVQIVRDGKIEYFNICKHFKSHDADLMTAYNKLFQ